MDFPVELADLLKHADLMGNKLAWHIQVNGCAVTDKLAWIKADNPIAKIGIVASQVTKEKHLSPTWNRNAHRLRLKGINPLLVYRKIHMYIQAMTIHTSQYRLTNTTIKIRAITHLPVKYCKRGSCPHRADHTLEEGR